MKVKTVTLGTCALCDRRARLEVCTCCGAAVCDECSKGAPWWWYEHGFVASWLCIQCAGGQSVEAYTIGYHPPGILDDSVIEPELACHRCGEEAIARIHKPFRKSSYLSCAKCAAEDITGGDIGWMAMHTPRQHNVLVRFLLGKLSGASMASTLRRHAWDYDWLERNRRRKTAPEEEFGTAQRSSTREDRMGKNKKEGLADELGDSGKSVITPKFVLPAAWKDADEFITECREAEKRSKRSLAEFIGIRYREVFEEDPPNVYIELLQAKVGYELQRRGFYTHDCGHLLTKRFWRNYEAAQALSIEDFVDRTRMFLEAAMREDNMTSRRRNVPKKAREKKESEGRKGLVGLKSGLSIIKTWIALFEANEDLAKAEKAPLTDEQITVALQENFPDRDTKAFHTVNAIRSRYNRGGFTNGTIPSRQSHRYDEDSNVITRRTRVAAPKTEKLKAVKSKKVKVRKAK